MMKKRGVSKYKNNAFSSKKKHIYSRLLDYFSYFVVSYLVFTIFNAIGANTPLVKNQTTQLNNMTVEMYQYVGSTHLQSYDSDKKTLVDSSVGATDYLKNLTLTSAYIHDIKYPEKQPDGTYIDVDVDINKTFLKDASNYELDNLSYFYKKYKKETPSMNSYVIDGVDYKDDIDTFLYIKIMAVTATDYVTSSDPDYTARGSTLSRYVVLTSENTTKMINRIAKGETIDPATVSLYNRTYNQYLIAIQRGIEDIEANSSDYKAIHTSFRNAYQELVKTEAIIYLLSYIFAFIVLTVVMRLISKEWITIGQKVMGLALCDTQEMEPAWWRTLLYHFLNFILFSSSCAISFFFIGIYGVLSAELIPHIPLFSLILVILGFNIISFVMSFFGKVPHDISTFVSRMYIKDIKDFDMPADVIDVQVDENEPKELEVKENEQ